MNENDSAQLVAVGVAGTGGILGMVVYLSRVLRIWSKDRTAEAVDRATNEAIEHWRVAAADTEARCQQLVKDLADMTTRANTAEREKAAVLAERSAMERNLSSKISELEHKLDAFGSLIDYMVASGRLADIPPDVLMRLAGIKRTTAED